MVTSKKLRKLNGEKRTKERNHNDKRRDKRPVVSKTSYSRFFQSREWPGNYYY